MAARLSYYQPASNGLLLCLPLQLTLRGKSTTQSYRTPVYYVDLTLRDGTNLRQAIQIAKEIDQQSKATGLNQTALDEMARQGFSNAMFEVNFEKGLDLVEQFYTDENSEAMTVQPDLKTNSKTQFNQGEGFVQDIQ